MKIAIITDDGKTVSKHFGRALFYLVAEIENGAVIYRETREKIGHGHFSAGEGSGHEHHEHNHEGGAHHSHGSEGEAHGKHTQMVQAISDCETVVCGGMGQGAYLSLQRLNIRPVVTDLNDIEEVINASINGTLTDHPELLH